MNKTLTIRADGSPNMGTGHVMRMIGLGQAWQALGGDVTFIGQASMLADRLETEGFKFLPIDSVHPDPADAQELLAQTNDSDWIAIDGYHFDSSYLEQIKNAGRRTLVVDDLFDRDDYPATLLLNQNPDGPTYPYQLPKGTLLTGTRYALLRNEFKRSDSTSGVPDTARKILVTMGGADPDNMTAKCLKAIATADESDLHVKVVAGAANPHLSDLEGLTTDLPFKCDLLASVKDMPELMRWADMAIAAAGTTSWELCFFGVPFMAIRIADNQKGVVRELQRHGAAYCLESKASLEDISTEFSQLVTDAQTRQSMSEAGQKLVDGKGARRVAKRMFNADVTLRQAQADDCETLLAWRNAPEARANSFSSEEIPLNVHQQWFESKLQDTNCLFLVAVDDGTPVGQIRFDRDGDRAVVSVSVAPASSNRGIGTAMTRLGCLQMAKKWPGTIVVAKVKEDNQASIVMFLKAGFTRDTIVEEDHLTFTWTVKDNEA